MSKRAIMSLIVPAALACAAGLTGCQGHRGCCDTGPEECATCSTEAPCVGGRCLPNSGTIVTPGTVGPLHHGVPPAPPADVYPLPMAPGHREPPAPPPPERMSPRPPMPQPQPKPLPPPVETYYAPPAEAENARLPMLPGNGQPGPMLAPMPVTMRPVSTGAMPGPRFAFAPPSRTTWPAAMPIVASHDDAAPLDAPQFAPPRTLNRTETAAAAAAPRFESARVPTIPWYPQTYDVAAADAAVEPWPYQAGSRVASRRELAGEPSLEMSPLVPEPLPDAGPSLGIE